ncbi:MAG: class I SAM-dependent methyltransferase [Parachlamydiales bacterium]|jgi:SAM-dependent methyltransferase
MSYFNLLKFAHSLWKKKLLKNSRVIDATAGNGHDTAALAQMLGKGELFVFDLQKTALENTKKLLQAKGLWEQPALKIHCFQKSHADFDPLIQKGSIDLAVYNLGYLPHGDKNLTTKTATTLLSLERALKLLKPQGALSIVAYPGHPEGVQESRAVALWFENLKNQEKIKGRLFFSALSEKAPRLFWLEKT